MMKRRRSALAVSHEKEDTMSFVSRSSKGRKRENMAEEMTDRLHNSKLAERLKTTSKEEV